MMDARSAANKMLSSMRSSCCHLGYGLIWHIEMLISENSSVPACQSQPGRWHRGNHVISSATTYPLAQQHDSTSSLRPWFMTYCSWNQGAHIFLSAPGVTISGRSPLKLFYNLKISKKWLFLSSFSDCLQFRRHVNLYKWGLRWQSHILLCIRKN